MTDETVAIPVLAGGPKGLAAQREAPKGLAAEPEPNRGGAG